MVATYCYLGMLDVRPVDPPVPQAESHAHTLQLVAEPIGAGEGGTRSLKRQPEPRRACHFESSIGPMYFFAITTLSMYRCWS